MLKAINLVNPICNYKNKIRKFSIKKHFEKISEKCIVNKNFFAYNSNN